MIRKLLKKNHILFIVAALILVAMVVHGLEFHHEHPKEIFGQDQQKAFLHGSDKKYWLAFILTSLMATAYATAKSLFLRRQITALALFPLNFLFFKIDLRQLFDPLRIALRRGILNPKLCA